MLKFYHI